MARRLAEELEEDGVKLDEHDIFCGEFYTTGLAGQLVPLLRPWSRPPIGVCARRPADMTPLPGSLAQAQGHVAELGVVRKM